MKSSNDAASPLSFDRHERPDTQVKLGIQLRMRQFTLQLLMLFRAGCNVNPPPIRVDELTPAGMMF
jgi:hypothetical protein